MGGRSSLYPVVVGGSSLYPKGGEVRGTEAVCTPKWRGGGGVEAVVLIQVQC